PVAYALLDDAEVLLEVELEDGERVLHVRGRGGDGDEWEHHVALLDVVLDPLLVDGDVALEESEALVGEEGLDLLVGHVEPVDLPVGGGEDALGERVPDEAVDAEDEDSHACVLDGPVARRRASSAPGRSMSPSS